MCLHPSVLVYSAHSPTLPFDHGDGVDKGHGDEEEELQFIYYEPVGETAL